MLGVSVFFVHPFVFWSTIFSSVHNFSSKVFDTHVQIWNHYKNIWVLWKVVTLIRSLKEKNSVEVSDYGWLTDEWHQLAYKLLQDAQDMKSFLFQQLNSFKAQERFCWKQKKFYDIKFFRAMWLLSAGAMQETLDASIESEWCATQSRVQYNAYKKVYDILEREYTFFSQRYDYWTVRRKELMRK